MSNQDHLTIFRNDYRPSPYLVDEIYLLLKLDPGRTRVTATSKLRYNPAFLENVESLLLDGENLKLIEILIDGEPVSKKNYSLSSKGIILHNPSSEFTLQIETEIDPQGNSSLCGLYRTSNNYCTQCEAEGFRRITYFLDRPDILALYTVRIEASATDCPVMLSNGNLIEKGDLAGGRHYAVWQDPFPKPCYLFALVAGDLVCIRDCFTTRSGKNVSLQIFVEHRNHDKCEHAMHSLKKAMKWDEDVYGLEYDLDVYMIVAVDDFNMGAMENKGLNIFNSKYVLASPDSATDQDYLGVEGVIGHEYFHNWTGNRVTCRDWFQLSLKEGLTVFRDQEFTADMNSRAVKRIDDVRVLRNFQFREDSGPMAHPVRPDSYVEINNFYTVTVYNKGAELIRMMHYIIGPDNFKKGIELYFSRFDGQAVTCDDFVQAMADASGVDLDQFKHWYAQSGTPVLSVTEQWDENNHQYTLDVKQHCDITPGQTEKKPFHIPIEVGLLRFPEIEQPKHEINLDEKKYKIELKQQENQFVFSDIKTKPVLSFLRNFTAPVKVQLSQSREELAFLMAHDTDLFNRWDAANRLSIEIIMDIIKIMKAGRIPFLDDLYVEAFYQNLIDDTSDSALLAQALTLPPETYLAQLMDVVEPALLHKAVKFIRKTLSTLMKETLIAVYYRNADTESYQITPQAIGRRNLKNCCLSYLMAPGSIDADSLEICVKQFKGKSNMTDVVAALSALSHYDNLEREEAFDNFYIEWKDNPLVMDKWFSLQATSSLGSTLSRVKELMTHESFSLRNPNKVRALIGSFCSLNHACFHDDTGSGYRFLAEQALKVDTLNSQIAARLVSAFTNYKNYSQKLKVMMQEQLRFILLQKNISADIYEIVKKSLD